MQMNEKSNVFLSSIGTGLEYYDFTIYALLIPYIGINFFQSSSEFATMTITLLVFAIGYFARPLGGILFGYLGDKYGRKKALIKIMILMACSTFLMGLLPTNKVGGNSMGVFFVFLRFIQGFSYGAELPCIVTFISEHSKSGRRGLNCGIMTSFVSIGVLLGSGIVFLLVHFLNKESMISWGWRVPFLIGGAIAVAAYFIRKNTNETESFLKGIEKSNILPNPTFHLFRNYYRNLFIGIGILLFPSFFILFFLVLPGYLQNVYKINSSYVYMAAMISYASTIITLPLFGMLSDKFGRVRSMVITLMIFIVFGGFLFKLISHNSLVTIIIFMLIYQLFISAMAGNYYPFLPELFPMNIRYSGIAVCYNIAFAIASLSPIIVGVVFRHFESTFSIAAVFIIIAFITMAACIGSKGYHEYIQR